MGGIIWRFYIYVYLPKTIASVFVAFLSFLAEDFSLFFLLALFTLYMVNRAAAEAFFSFFDPLEAAIAILFAVDTDLEY